MIRINLLPQKREVRREAGQAWLIALMVALAVEAIAIVLYHQYKRGQLSDQRGTNSELEAQIAQIQSAVGNHQDVKKRLEILRAREQAITQLQAARKGPTAVMLELSRVLTAGRGPTTDADKLAQLAKDNPTAVYNPGWDARRLWITSFTEQNRTVKLEAIARDGEDVSEIAKRLSLSDYFYDIRLLPGGQSRDAKSRLEFVKFSLEAKVRY